MNNPKEELTPIYQNVKPLNEKTKGIHTDEEEKPKEEETKDNNEGEELNEEPKDNNEEETKDNEEEEEEEEGEPKEQPGTSETSMTPVETTLSTNEAMEHYNKIIDDFYKDNDAEKYFKRIKYLTVMLPESKFEELAEEEAEKLSQMNFNGVKLFKDIAEARQFLHDLRYGRRNRFKGQNQKFYKLPKIQKIINQSKQMKQTISPMMARNIKPLTRTNYIYEY